ncbi:MAG: peroxiredoxin [Vicingaceae bacterium]
MANKLKVGDEVPSFCLKDQDNNDFCVNGEDGKNRVIYFYPKNNTRKCTEQACTFRDWQDTFIDLGYEVIGISNDSVQSHQNFKLQHRLNFTLLSDRNNNVRKQFGATSFFGLIPDRKTFIINKDGKITFIYEALLEGQEHIKKVLNQIKAKES